MTCRTTGALREVPADMTSAVTDAPDDVRKALAQTFVHALRVQDRRTVHPTFPVCRRYRWRPHPEFVPYWLGVKLLVVGEILLFARTASAERGRTNDPAGGTRRAAAVAVSRPAQVAVGERSGTLIAVAQIHVNGGLLVVRLNLLETAMAARRSVRVPLDAVESVTVEDRPLTRASIMNDVTMGFAAASAPAMTLATVGPRAKHNDGRALLIVWRNGRSVVIRLAPNDTAWRRLVISRRDAEVVAARVRAASGR